MRYLIKVRLPIEEGNRILRNPKFSRELQSILEEIKAEAAYFSLIDGQRGMYIITSFDDASQIAVISEKFWFWGKADLEIIPVMIVDDLVKAGPAIETTTKKYGSKK